MQISGIRILLENTVFFQFLFTKKINQTETAVIIMKVVEQLKNHNYKFEYKINEEWKSIDEMNFNTFIDLVENYEILLNLS